MRKLLVTVLLLFSFESGSYAQLDSIVRLLSEKSFFLPIKTGKEFLNTTGNAEVDSIITARYRSSAHFYYHLLDSLASDQELIKLTSHGSPVIQSYAAVALGFRDTLLLPGVLKKMLDANRLVSCEYGCIGPQLITGSMLFYGLYKRNRASGFPTEGFIERMDSIFLSNKNTPLEETNYKLLSLRSKSLNPVIETLAFKRKSLLAIDYLYEWYKGEYYVQLNKICLELLDTDLVHHNTPFTNYLIPMLIDLNSQATLRKLGHWLKYNRQKWSGIKNIDNELDKSHDLKDSIGWGADRYPVKKKDVDFLLGDWVIISGMDINNLNTLDTIILERKAAQNINAQKLGFDLTSNSLYSYYYESIADKKCKMVGTPIFDSGNLRINFGSTGWDWYKIIRQENRLILSRE